MPTPRALHPSPLGRWRLAAAVLVALQLTTTGACSAKTTDHPATSSTPNIVVGAHGLLGQVSVCAQTFTPSSVGSNPDPGSTVNTAVHNASAGDVLCFASGTYGDIDLYADHPPGMVTLQPATGAAVSIGTFNLNGVSNITMTGFSGSSSSNGLIVQVADHGNNSNITFSNNAMTSNGVMVRGNANANANINITGNSFIGFASSGEQDRVNISQDNGCPNGITVSNNHMSGGRSDGIDTTGGSCGTVISGNEIDHIDEPNCGAIHCDGFQDNGGGKGTVITGNYFHDDFDCFLLDDGSSNITISNNVCSTASDSNYWMQFGGGKTVTLDHNTIVSPAAAQYGNDHDGNASSNVTFTNNVWPRAPALNDGQPVSGTTTINHNLGSDIPGRPVFVGPLTSFAGYALTSTSPGHAAAADGTDLGISAATSSAGTATTTAPAPPPTPSAPVATAAVTPAITVAGATRARTRERVSKAEHRVSSTAPATLVRHGRFRVACAAHCRVTVVTRVRGGVVAIARGPGTTVVLNVAGHRLCAQAPTAGHERNGADPCRATPDAAPHPARPRASLSSRSARAARQRLLQVRRPAVGATGVTRRQPGGIAGRTQPSLRLRAQRGQEPGQ